MAMAMQAQHVLQHGAALFPSCVSSVGSAASLSPADSMSSCSIFCPPASSRTTTRIGGLTESISLAPQAFSSCRIGGLLMCSRGQRRQPRRTGVSFLGCRVRLQGYLGCRILPSPRWQELIILQPHVLNDYLPVCKSVSSRSQAVRVWETVSCKVNGTGDCQPQRHWIGAQVVFVQSSQRRNAQRGSGSERSSDEGTSGKKGEEEAPAEEGENMAVEDKLADELEDNTEKSGDERVKLKDVSERLWFWRGWWRTRGQTEIDNVADDKGKEEEELEKPRNKAIEEAQGSEHNVGETKSGREGADIEQTEESGGGDRRDETVPREKAVQTKEENIGLWRRVWKQEVIVDEDPLGPEEELILQDLETLTFNWKDLLDPTLENLLALGFTVLLALALFKIIWQLIAVVTTIIFSALKYTVLAAFVVGLLIFLL